MFELKNLLRKNVQNLKPYSSARNEYSGEAAVFLDANENAYGSASGEYYNRYPDPLQRELKAGLARVKGVSAAHIFLGNGSDEVVDLLFRSVCVPGQDNIVVPTPTYGMYAVWAGINDIAVKEVPLGLDFRLDSKALLDAVDDHTKLIFVCSPNNPTGNLMDPAEIVLLLQNSNCLVVVDEAYIDYAPDLTLLKHLDDFPNLVIVQTFSKAWGYAGLRIGIGFGSEELVEILTRIKSPYNISELSQQKALEALDHVDQMREMAAAAVTERNLLRLKLQLLVEVVDIFLSDANFLLVKMENAEKVYNYLLDHGVVVRDRSSLPGCENCLRITIGTPAENQRVIELMQALEES